jgi:hypothetical protein
MPDFRTFVLGESVSQSLLENQDAAKVFNFLAKPQTINNMIVFSDLRLPVLSGIVESLENKFENATDFTLKNDHNRQVVGKMIKFILDFYGYFPIKNINSSEKRLRNFSNAKLFKTSAVYQKINKEAKIELVIKIIQR